MKLVLKDGTAIELAMGNNQNQFVIYYVDDVQLAEIESLLTTENLSDAHYEINGAITDTLKNKVLSGSNKNVITKKVTYYITDAKTAEMEQMKATVEEQNNTISELSDLVDMLLVTTLEPTEEDVEENTDEITENVTNEVPEDEEVEEDVQQT